MTIEEIKKFFFPRELIKDIPEEYKFVDTDPAGDYGTVSSLGGDSLVAAICAQIVSSIEIPDFVLPL